VVTPAWWRRLAWGLIGLGVMQLMLYAFVLTPGAAREVDYCPEFTTLCQSARRANLIATLTLIAGCLKIGLGVFLLRK